MLLQSPRTSTSHSYLESWNQEAFKSEGLPGCLPEGSISFSQVIAPRRWKPSERAKDTLRG
jgi:hypothetical protein